MHSPFHQMHLRKDKDLSSVNIRTNNKLKVREKMFLGISHNRIINDLPDEKAFLIHHSLLGIKDANILSFRLKENSQHLLDETSIQKLLFLLNNSDTSLIKFGIYITRKYFKDKLKNEPIATSIEHGYTIDQFISMNIFQIFINIINTQLPNEQCVLFEVLWTLLNLSNYPSSYGNEPYAYYSLVFTNEYIDLYKKVLSNSSTPIEIIDLLYQLLYNVSIDNEKIRNVIKDEKFVEMSMNILNRFVNHSNVNQAVFRFLSNITQDYNKLSTSEANFYFEIFKAPIPLITSENDGTPLICLVALRNLSKINSSSFLLNFISFQTAKHLMDLILHNILQESNIIIFIIEILSELIMCDNSIIHEQLYKWNIIPLYKHVLLLIDNEFSNFGNEIKKETIMSLANIIMYIPNAAFDIANDNEMFTLIIKHFDSSEYALRKFTALFMMYLFDYVSLTVFNKVQLVLNTLIEHLILETSEGILSALVCTVTSIINTAKRKLDGTGEGLTYIVDTLKTKDIYGILSQKKIERQEVIQHFQRLKLLLDDVMLNNK